MVQALKYPNFAGHKQSAIFYGTQTKQWDVNSWFKVESKEI